MLPVSPVCMLPNADCKVERVFADDLDRLPLPDEVSGLPLIRKPRTYGFPCSAARLSAGLFLLFYRQHRGFKVRARSPQFVVEHLARMADVGFRQFYFVDNTFNLPPSSRDLPRHRRPAA